jgi:hypothetical protein
MYRIVPGLVLMLLACAATVGFTQIPLESPLLKEAAIPALVVGAKSPVPFAVHGRFFTDTGKGLAFQIATDGKKQRCIFYDPADGTPIFISDGEQSLIYDLETMRVVRWKDGVGKVWLDWTASDERQFNLDFQILRSDASKESLKCGVVLDGLLSTNAYKATKQTGANGVTRFIFQQEDRAVTIQKAPRDSSWFRLTAVKKGKRVLELEARYIGKPLPEGVLIFPDTAELAKTMTVIEVDNATIESLIPNFLTGRILVPKIALALGSEKEGELKEFAWNDLRQGDVKLGAQYRAALTKQDIRFIGFGSPPQNPKTP